MWEAFFGSKKTPFPDNPDAKQLFASQAWNQVKTRLDFLAAHHGVGLLTGEVGSGKSTAARTFTAALPLHQYKILYVHFSSGSALDLLRQVALELNLTPAHYRGDLVRQIAEAVVRLNWRRVPAINALEDSMKALSDEALAAKTEEFRARLADGATLIVDQVDELAARVGDLAADFEDVLRTLTSVNLYAGWRTQKGFDLL